MIDLGLLQTFNAVELANVRVLERNSMIKADALRPVAETESLFPNERMSHAG